MLVSRTTVRVVLAVWVLCAGTAERVHGQAFEALGTRAQGLGGAFVAVADDASSIYWNPAGQVAGPLFSFAIDAGTVRSGAGEAGRRAGGAALRTSSRLVALTTMPLGIGFYRLRAHASGSDVSRDSQPSPVASPVAALVTNHLSFVVGQTLGPALALGAAVDVVRGQVAGGVAPAGADPFDVADDLPGDGSMAVDLHVGAIATFGPARLGLVARNLFRPEFEGEAGLRLAPDRHVRAGVALRPADRIVLALDADLTTTGAIGGRRRNVAAGVETWWVERRIGVRAGFRASTVGEARPVGAAGLSVGVLPALFVEAQVTRGVSDADRGWSAGVGSRYGF